METVKIKLLLFGIAREIGGSDSIEIILETPASVGRMQKYLIEHYPKMNELRSFMIAVNQEYAEPDVVIIEGDEVAVIPPVSGG